MALSVVTGPGALVSLGIGIGDVATIIGLGNRIGNWWTSSDGDKNLLKQIDIDETVIFRRQGLLDLASFNKRWRKNIRLLANNQPLKLAEPEITKVLGDVGNLLGDLSLFSSVLICISATLDCFFDSTTAQAVIFDLLRHLIGAVEIGEDILRSQYHSRINGWRSTACLRGFTNASQAFRVSLMQSGSILGGLTPAGESRHVLEFLEWLIGTREEYFETPSSDVAGIAACLAHLGIDVVHVQGPGFGIDDATKPCTVVYSADCSMSNLPPKRQSELILSKVQATTVPIQESAESVCAFPGTLRVTNDYRLAWEAGKNAASFVRIGLYPEDSSFIVHPDGYSDMVYAFMDKRHPGPIPMSRERPSIEISTLARHHAFAFNHELIRGLQDCLGGVDASILRWIDAQTGEDMPGGSSGSIRDPGLYDDEKIEAFTRFQAFFMGYYYDLFFRLVDTSSLALQTVEGAWGFRSPEFLLHLRSKIIQRTQSSVNPDLAICKRQQLIPVLVGLFLGTTLEVPLITSVGQRSKLECMGVIRNRTLVINSLVGKCRTPQEVGGFTLLDVDVGGIPRDHNGLIRPGLQLPLDRSMLKAEDAAALAREDISETGPAEDVTFNIEADWDGDPDSTLICVRCKGRRISSISPARTDITFLSLYKPPESSDRGRSRLGRGIEVDVESLLNAPSTLRLARRKDKVPLLFQALGQPYLRYAAVALYSRVAPVYLVADCVRTTAESAMPQDDPMELWPQITGPPNTQEIGPVLIAGITTATDDSPHTTIKKVQSNVWLFK